MDTDRSRSDQILTRPDGRWLGYAELGDPQGRPLFFFHGTPGSRRVLSESDALARIPGLRMILPERPGYGLSDRQPGRTLRGWADDVAALADQLGIERFHVAGVSGGGPHALVCAHALPSRVRAALLLASPSPAGVRDTRRGMSAGNRLGLALARWAPGLVRRSVASFAEAFKRDPEACLDLLARQMSASDQRLMRDIALREALIRDLREAYRRNGDGHADDGALAMTGRDWGFDLREVQTTVHLWHGEEDRLAPVAMGRYLAGTLPRCQAHFVAGAGHLLTEHPAVVTEFEAALNGPDA